MEMPGRRRLRRNCVDYLRDRGLCARGAAMEFKGQTNKRRTGGLNPLRLRLRRLLDWEDVHGANIDRLKMEEGLRLGVSLSIPLHCTTTGDRRGLKPCTEHLKLLKLRDVHLTIAIATERDATFCGE